MCGICGICFSDSAARVDDGILRSMTAALAHRGPDGDGFLLRGNIGFGHRRLSIIDIDGGDQPIFNQDGRIGIVFNGEIYNYIELREELIERGHVFRTRSDTEVIVHLYEEHGEACVEHLRGMFAFAIWDGHEGRVFLARDRLGIKPLSYVLLGDRLVFASELKAILADRTVRRVIDPEVLAEYLAYGYVPGDRCILSGFSKLSPGHTLTWCRGNVRIHKYWDVDHRIDSTVGPGDRDDALDDVLSESVRLHLRSDVPVGVLLSGGIDSAAMVALAASVVNRPLQTFSVGFADQKMNELPVAKLTAERYGTEHREIIVSDRDISILPDIVRHLDEPFADPSALATYYVCREAARHVKVCLSGDGADELFAGYSRYHEAMAYRRTDWIPPAVRRAILTPVLALMPDVMWGKGLLERIRADGAERYMRQIGIFPVAECDALLTETGRRKMRHLTRPLDPFFGANGSSDLHPVSTLQLADQKTYLPDDILVKTDRMSMQNSLELRPPFLDHKVVEFANRCPPGEKLHEGTGKTILRRILRERIPQEALRRPKTGFGIPIKHWFREGLEGMARELLLAPSARSAAFFDRSTVERIVTGHQYGMRDFSRRIWSLVVFEQWCRCFEVAS